MAEGRTSTRFTVIVLLVAALAGIMLLLAQREGTDHPAPAATTESAAAPASGGADVQVMTPIRRDVAYTISLPANVAPLYQTILYAKVSGYLSWIGPDKGDRVKKGQVLAIIDAPEVEQQYQQLVADYKIKKLTYQRLANVLKETPDVIAKQDVDIAEAAYSGAKHSMEQAEALRNYMKVIAPYDGVITARFADPGALIQIATNSATSAIPVFTIMDLDTVRIYANVPQEDSPLVKIGTPATLSVRELPGRPFAGTVTRTTQSLDPSTRSLLVEVDLANPDHALQPGTFGELTLKLRVSPNALVIPPAAISTYAGKPFVFIVEDGKVVQRPVKTGLSDGKWTEVADGLSGQEAVVVVGKSKLVAGAPVQSSPYNLPEGTPSVQKYTERRPKP